MGANSKSISLAGAATLLLAIAATITLASCMDGGQKYSLRINRGRPSEVQCDTEKWRVLPENPYSEIPSIMLQQLKDLLEKTSATTDQEELNRRFYAKRLVSFSELNEQDVCQGIEVSEISQLLSPSGDRKFRRYYGFVKHYLSIKLQPCALKIIHDLDTKPNRRLNPLLRSLAQNNFFTTVLGVDYGSLNHQQMYDHVVNVKLRKEQFSLWENQISGVRSILARLKTSFNNRVKIVNLAVDVGAITLNKLTPKFLLIREYSRLADQIESWDAYNSMRQDYRRQIDRDYTFKIDENEVTIWVERPDVDIEQWLPPGNDYSEDPQLMLQQLNAQLEPIDRGDAEGSRWSYHIRTLLSYTRLETHNAHLRFNMQDFLRFISMSGQHKRYADFAKHYGRIGLARLAPRIIQNFDREPNFTIEVQLGLINLFFRAALGIRNDHLSDEMMYYYIRGANLADVEFDVPAMLELLRTSESGSARARARASTSESESSSSVYSRWRKLVRDLESTLYQLKDLVVSEVNIVNLAVGLGAIGEEHLTPKFRLMNEYVNFALQIKDLIA